MHCDQDINECEVNKEVCNYGICVNTNGLLSFFHLNLRKCFTRLCCLRLTYIQQDIFVR